MASGLSSRVSAIEGAIALLGHFRDRLRYLSPATADLIEAACGCGGLADIPYLRACRDGMGGGEPFPTSWREALRTERGALDPEDARILLELGDVLGSTDLTSQLAAVEYARDQLELRLEGAREYRDRHHKLYTTLGLLGGCAVSIILL